MSEKTHLVEVVSYADGSIVKTLGPHPERTAEKVADGISINLDDARFYARVALANAPTDPKP